MRGHVEESEEVKAWRDLRRAANAYAARFLKDMHSGSGSVDTIEEAGLRIASLVYADAVRPLSKRVERPLSKRASKGPANA